MLHLDWNATVNLLKATMPQTQFRNWVLPVEFLRSNETSVVLGVPNRFHEEWLRNHYTQRISDAIRQSSGTEVQLEFEVLATQAAPSASHEAPSVAVTPTVRPILKLVKDAAPPPAEPVISPPNLPTFNHAFLELGSNRVAYQCLLLLAEHRNPYLNTLVLVGNVGTGKTHLLAELGQRVFANNRKMRVRYTTAENFTGEMFRCLKNDALIEFKQKYAEDTDLLLFDQVEGLANRKKTQELLLHIFNEITARGGRVAFTSSVHPNRMTDLIEPLRSRLFSAILAEIQPPTTDDRVELLSKIAAQQGIEADAAALRTLAERNMAQDIRETIGSLVRWHLQAKLSNQALDSHYVATQVPQEHHREAVNMQEIVGLVETTFGVTRTELFSKSRKGKVNWARQVAMYLARMHTLLPLEEIGKTFGRDHATVIYAFQRVQQTVEEQPTKRYEVEFLRRKLQARTPRSLNR